MLKPDCFVTDNGIRTVVYEDPGLGYQSGAVYVDTSRVSQEDLNYPHFTEHVLVLDKEQFGGQSLLQAVEATANRSHAGTYPEVVEFTFAAVPQDAPKVFKMLLDAVAKPVISDTSVENEKKIIGSEMRERAAQAETGLYERAWDNHGFTHTAVQENAGVDAVTRDDIADFHRRWFVGSNIFVVTAGPTSAEDIATMITNTEFREGPLTAGGGINYREFTPPASRIVSGRETDKTTHYLQMYDLPTADEVTILLDNINGTIRQDSLLSRARDVVGVYGASLRSFRYPYTKNARTYLSTEGDDDKVKGVHELAETVLHELADSTPLDALLDHAKHVVRNRAVLGDPETPGALVHSTLCQLPQFPTILSFDERMACMERVSPQDIRDRVRALLAAPRSFSLVGADRSVAKLTEYLEQ